MTSSEAALAIRRIIREELESVGSYIRRDEKTAAEMALAAAVAKFRRVASGLSVP